MPRMRQADLSQQRRNLNGYKAQEVRTQRQESENTRAGNSHNEGLDSIHDTSGMQPQQYVDSTIPSFRNYNDRKASFGGKPNSST